MCAGFARDQAELERLVLFRDESRRADLDETFLDEDLEVLRGRQKGACHHPDGGMRTTSMHGLSPLQWTARIDTRGLIWIAPV